MKDPKDFTHHTDLPIVFHEAMKHRIGDFEDVKKLSRRDIVKEQAAWILGSPSWYTEFEKWLNAAGLEIVEKP